MRGWKGQVHEGGVRVPCFLSWQNHLPDNQDIDPIAAHIDLLPTLAELCQIDLPKGLDLDGKSLVPLLKNPSSNWDNRHIYTIHTEGQMRPWPAAVRTARYRMVVNRKQAYQLYDMQNDPTETNNIATEMPELLDSLKTDFENWFKQLTQKGITVPPIPVGFAQRPFTFLPAPEAQLSGEVKFQGKMGWANDYIVNWIKEGDAATWEIEVEAASKYEVFLHYNATKEAVGNVLSLEIMTTDEKKDIQNLIRLQTPFWTAFLDSPDKVKRGEVYEKEWGKMSLGNFPLKKGKMEIVLKLNKIKGGSLLEVKGLELKRLD